MQNRITKVVVKNSGVTLSNKPPRDLKRKMASTKGEKKLKTEEEKSEFLKCLILNRA